MEYTTKKVISHGVLDPNVCVEIDGRLYRKIATVRPEDNGRWAKTGEFMRTPECQRLIEEGLLVPRSSSVCGLRFIFHNAAQRSEKPYTNEPPVKKLG